MTELVKITKYSELYLYKCICELEEEGLIKKHYNKNNKSYQIYSTKLGKEIYMKNKIDLLIKKKIIKEVDSLAPYICEGCVYYKEKLSNLCEYIKCDSNKIYMLNQK